MTKRRRREKLNILLVIIVAGIYILVRIDFFFAFALVEDYKFPIFRKFHSHLFTTANSSLMTDYTE